MCDGVVPWSWPSSCPASEWCWRPRRESNYWSCSQHRHRDQPRPSHTQHGLEDAFNELDHGEMLRADTKCQACMLPYTLWSYRHSDSRFVRVLPEGTPLILSEQGVRQGDACPAFYFALTEQDVLQKIALRQPATSPVAYTDDECRQGPLASVTAVFPTIC